VPFGSQLQSATPREAEFVDCDQSIWTTNGQERLNQEIKRRTRVVRIFPNRESCLRLVSALAVEQSEEWVTGRRYLDMREFGEHRQEELAVEGVKLIER